MIWVAAIGLLVGTGLGVVIMCVFNVSAGGGDREVRILMLRMALSRLLVAAQGYTETGDGFEELAGAMSNAAEVLGA